MRRTKGFSLVELLVVIGIIVILISILLPTVNKVRSEGLKLKCMSNLHTLVLAQMMYVSESGGYLPFPNWSSDRSDTTNVWTYGWLYSQGQISSPPIQDDVKHGVLYRYINTTEVYHCPAHEPGSGTPEGTDRLTSYIVNGAVCGYGAVGTKNASPVHWMPSWKITDWKKPSDQIFMWEAEENGSGAAWNDGASYPPENVLSARHGRGAGVACFDGHVEWMNRVDYLTELARPGPNRLYCDPNRADGGAGAMGY